MTARLPSWAREFSTLLPACAHFLFSGNVRDKYLAGFDADDSDPGDRRALMSLPRILAEVAHRQGIEHVLLFDISRGVLRGAADPDPALEAALGGRPVDIAPVSSLDGLAALVERLSEATTPMALVIESASRLARDPAQLSDQEFEFFRRIDRVARDSRPCPHPTGRPLFNPIAWILDKDSDLPPWLSLGNEFMRSIVLPLPHTGERRALADRLVATLGDTSDLERASGARVLTEQTAGMSLVAIQQTIAIAKDLGLGPERVEDAARSYRVGVTDNPWKAEYLLQRLRAETAAFEDTNHHGESVLGGRVLGQEVAVRRSLDILVRSATGLTAAHAAATATRPRGVLFFAGPTGVGKTELAKSLTKLLFDDERFYIRFDMSEFSAEHAADRLIGAPPGYTGYGSGGELTNAIRQRPFSVVLFDEIEKAHPRILDKFLQVLDDGRLTDGRGDTAYFTEAVIIFTSNLGIYAEVEETSPSGPPMRRRQPTVNRADVSYEEMTARIQAAIRDYFTLQLGRPELLNRIGDNIVVFDYINRATGRDILDSMLGNIVARVKQEYGVTLKIPDTTRDRVAAECIDGEYLELGGRGIGSKLETFVVNPLANWIFTNPPPPGTTQELQIEKRDGAWIAAMS